MKYISVDVKILISARIEKEEFEDIQTKLGAALRKEFFTKKYYEISKSKLPFKEWEENNSFKEKYSFIKNYQESISIRLDFNSVKFYGFKKLKELIISLIPKNYYVSKVGRESFFFEEGNTNSYIVNIENIKGSTEENHRFLYHFSPLKNKNNILKKGIIPRKSIRNGYTYPKRVYCTSYFELASIRTLRGSIENYGKPKKQLMSFNTPLVVFKIDTSKTNAKFYTDSSSEDGVWTESIIQPKSLTIIHEDPVDYISKKDNYYIDNIVDDIERFECPIEYISWFKELCTIYVKKLLAMGDKYRHLFNSISSSRRKIIEYITDNPDSLKEIYDYSFEQILNIDQLKDKKTP